MREYEDLPQLRVTQSHGTYQYRVQGNYVSKREKDYVLRLVQKEYYNNLLNDLEEYVDK